MKKLLLVCCIVLGVSTLSRAQGGGGGGRGQQQTPEQRVATMKTSLALTDAQSAKILAIYQAQTKSNDSLRAAANGGQPDRTASMAIRTATTAKINSVLTPDQQAAFAKMQPAGRGGRGGGGGGGGTPPATPPPAKG